jgi:hypothetical protein
LREKIDEVEEERGMTSGNGGFEIDIDKLSQGKKL